MMLTVDTEGLEFCSKIFDDVRAMSKDGPGVTRQGYGPVETKTLDYLTAIGRDLGLEIKKDPAGNVWMTLPGKDRTLPAFVSGSHADSVPEGGNYDGLAGITAALYTARAMKKAGFTPKRDFTVLMMRCEESSFYGKSYIGSLAFTGKLTPDVTALTDRTKEKTLGEHMRECGFDPEKLTTGKPLMDLKKIAAFVELHIEQGPTLTSSETVRTGIVTGIRGNIRHKQVKIIGETAHSGAVDKPYRHDAVLACADFLSRMDKAWDEFLAAGDDLVFTVGVLKTAPTAAISVIPGEVTFTVDMRSLKLETVEKFHAKLLETAQAVSKARGVKFEFDKKLITDPASVNPELMQRLEATAKTIGLPVRLIASGAGHDAAVIGAADVPVAMIFVANQNGSHNPHEAMKLDDFMLGAELLKAAVMGYDA